MFKAGVQLALSILEFLTGANPRTAEGYLTLLDYACGLFLASTYFLDKAFWLQSQPDRQWASLALLVLIGVKYLLSRISVRQELTIGRSLFPSDRVPNDLRQKDRVKITREVIAFMALYALLGSMVGNIFFASLFMTGIAFFDFVTRDRINEGIRQRFADISYDPRPEDADFDGIMRRRQIARWYLFSLPHLSKELACIDGCAAAFGIAAYGHFIGADLSIAAYATLIGTQILNEIVTLWWRYDRFARLKAIVPPTKSKSALWIEVSTLISIPFDIFEFLTGENPRASEGYLDFLDYVGGLLLGLLIHP